VAGSAQISTVAGETLPAEPTYQPVIPFYPPIFSGNSGVSSGVLGAAGSDDWKKYPDNLDLFVYQGDDVQIPLYFQDPTIPNIDLSTSYVWKGQIRVVHHYKSALVNEFTIATEIIPPDPLDPTSLGSTLVTLFLPRFNNQYSGVYTWDLQSTSPFVGPVYPKPPDVDDEDWPMADQVKTWLYGNLHVVPRVTETDFLPVPSPAALPPGTAVVVTPAGWAVGPNGRVP
jgi:hypothetical protein